MSCCPCLSCAACTELARIWSKGPGVRTARLCKRGLFKGQEADSFCISFLCHNPPEMSSRANTQSARGVLLSRGSRIEYFLFWLLGTASTPWHVATHVRLHIHSSHGLFLVGDWIISCPPHYKETCGCTHSSLRSSKTISSLEDTCLNPISKLPFAI